eukprot:Rhum_TRINITY_DN660_c0_g1::Rhum_TRINITY_DN660_c0_g1_i1::g.2062::m.2062
MAASDASTVEKPAAPRCPVDPFESMIDDADRLVSRKELASRALLQTIKGRPTPLRVVAVGQVASSVEVLEREKGVRPWGVACVVLKVKRDGGKVNVTASDMRRGLLKVTVPALPAAGRKAAAGGAGKTPADEAPDSLRKGALVLFSTPTPYRQTNPFTHEMSFALSVPRREGHVHVVGYLATLSFCQHPVYKKGRGGIGLEKKRPCSEPVDTRTAFQGYCAEHAKLAKEQRADAILGGETVESQRQGEERRQAFAAAAAGLLAKKRAQAESAAQDAQLQEQEAGAGAGAPTQEETAVAAKRRRYVASKAGAPGRKQAFAAVLAKEEPLAEAEPAPAPVPAAEPAPAPVPV